MAESPKNPFPEKVIFFKINFAGKHESVIPVPVEIKGLDNIADYMTKYEANKYAQGLYPNPDTPDARARFNTTYQNYYDAHIENIRGWLYDYRERLSGKLATMTKARSMDGTRPI